MRSQQVLGANTVTASQQSSAQGYLKPHAPETESFPHDLELNLWKIFMGSE